MANPQILSMCSSPGQAWSNSLSNPLNQILNVIGGGPAPTASFSSFILGGVICAVYTTDAGNPGNDTDYVFVLDSESFVPISYRTLHQDPAWWLPADYQSNNFYPPDDQGVNHEWFVSYIKPWRDFLATTICDLVLISNGVIVDGLLADPFNKYAYYQLGSTKAGLWVNMVTHVEVNSSVIDAGASSLLARNPNQFAATGVSLSASGSDRIAKAIESLQTNVSINHGQAIFSVQGGAITGP
jgi:hypothetical protein